MAEYGLHRPHYYYGDPKKSVQFAKIVRKSGEFSALHDSVYDALILPQVKAMRQWMKGRTSQYPFEYGLETVELCFNAIVLRDHLFTLDLDDPSSEPVPAGRASFVRQIEQGDISGRYLVDFVTQSHLAHYVKVEIGGFIQAIKEAFEESPMRFRANGANETPPDSPSPHPDAKWGK